MAITRARLSLKVPWRRGSDAAAAADTSTRPDPVTPSPSPAPPYADPATDAPGPLAQPPDPVMPSPVQAMEAPETAPRVAFPTPQAVPNASATATTSGARSPARRGPDGRFMRRSDAPDASPVDPPLAALDAAPPPPAIVGRPWPAPVRPEAPVATIAAADAAWPEVHPDVDDAGGTPEPRGADAPSPTALRPADPGQIEDALSAPRPIRIVLVEDVPDVATHVRDMLRWQPRFR
jgi:hypothetical protein